MQYTKGDLGRASAALRDAEPGDVPADIGHILALVKGTIFAGQDAGRALAYLDYARLVGPGTLIEEAALRRSISLSVETNDNDRFLGASEQYVRRFLHSPYASQFADSFVAGVVRLQSTIDLGRTSAIIDGMTPEQAKVVYLRLARQAAIERLSALLAFATSALETHAPEAGDDPRAALYSALALVASEEIMDVREQLARIDASRLSSSDRVLLEAAKALVHIYY
jgi:chemotaxis protein MotC